MTTSVKPDLTKPFKNFQVGSTCIGPVGYLAVLDEPYVNSIGDWYVKTRVLEPHKKAYNQGDLMSFRLNSMFVFDEKYGRAQYAPADIQLAGLTGGFSNAIFLDFRVYTMDVQNESQKWWLHALLWDYHQSELLHMIYDHKNDKWSIVNLENWKNYFPDA